MKLRHVVPLIFCALCPVVWASAQPGSPSQPAPVYRHIIVVDTSLSMALSKESTIDAIHKLLLSSILGRMRTGDTLGIWTFDERVRKDFVPARLWDARGRPRLDFANLVYRLLDRQEFVGRARLDSVIEGLTREAKRSGSLTVFLFTDGSKPLKGTPFDEAINGIFSGHAVEMRNAGKAFLTVLVADKGEWVAHSVNPCGFPIHIPPVPKPEGSGEEAGKESAE